MRVWCVAREEIIEVRMKLKPLVDLAVRLPAEKLEEAEELLDVWIEGRITRKELISRLEQLASGGP